MSNDKNESWAEYRDLGICLIKRNPAGGYFEVPLCSKCELPLSSLSDKKLICVKCKVVLDSAAVMAEIRKALA